MKITEYYAENEEYRGAVKIVIDGETIIDIYDGEPEDNTLMRNFNIDFKEFAQKVFDGAKTSEVLEYEFKKVTWEEFWEIY